MKYAIWIALLIAVLDTYGFAGSILPAGPHMDEELSYQWDTKVKDQRFPLAPHASALPKETEGAPSDRQRYILHLGTVNLKTKTLFHEGVHWYKYDSPETGKIMLIVHPELKQCLDGAREKYDMMQMVVFPNGEWFGWQAWVVEQPRQCRGDYAPTGGKLKKASAQ